MLKLYNTLTNKKEEFKSQEKGKVKMYSCGPTVYDYAHIGNLAAYIYADLLKRYLEYSGYEVRHIMNITDVGHLTEDDVNQADSGQDKMLKAALREKKTPLEIADFYVGQFFNDVEKLNIKKANYYPRATKHIQQMIKIIEGLIEKGLAYEKNGNVFYDVEKFGGYGKLSKKKLEDLRHGARLKNHPDKKHSYDFALWLKAPKEHLLKWESPWSTGYPGWHIECSAMAMEYLGETLDIHSGGEDHIFPHHENEIAQSEGCTGKMFANFWFHNRFLLVDGEKMSKSKGNFYTLKDIIGKGYHPLAFKFLVLSSHYQSNLNFTWESIRNAQEAWKTINEFFLRIKNLPKIKNKTKGIANVELKTIKEDFNKSLSNNLNTPEALGSLFALIKYTNQEIINKKNYIKNYKEILDFLKNVNKIFGIFDLKYFSDKEKEILPDKVDKLSNEREIARMNKDFEKADKLREKIGKLGFEVEDTLSGQIIRKK